MVVGERKLFQVGADASCILTKRTWIGDSAHNQDTADPFFKPCSVSGLGFRINRGKITIAHVGKIEMLTNGEPKPVYIFTKFDWFDSFGRSGNQDDVGTVKIGSRFTQHPCRKQAIIVYGTCIVDKED